jgi:uncharacterized protein (DUF362 family)
MRHVSRRRFLELASILAGATASGCIADPAEDDARHDPVSGAGGSSTPGDETVDSPSAPGPHSVAVTAYEDPALRAAAIAAAVEMAGGMPWMKPGDSVLIKVAHNSPNPYPAVASPVACAELVRMCLDAGAGKVFVADLMGIENTLVPGGWALEDPFGSGFDRQNDATIRAFVASGIYDAVVAEVGIDNVGPGKPVELTSFREHGWYRYESASDTAGAPYLVSSWVRDQIEIAEAWDKKPLTTKYKKRAFDLLGDDVPGMYVPVLCRDVDHILNLHRVSTHVMSHFTLALKNWVGIMRPDDRIWMHQLSYLLNHRGVGEDPIRTEPPYNLLLAELHASTLDRERLIVADATDVIASGGPDESDKDLFPAQLVVAARDLVSADVVGLSIIRMAVMASHLDGGLGGLCSPPPQSAGSLTLGFLGSQVLPWKHAMYGNDGKLCDPSFSHWDWVAIQRARELGMGCPDPSALDLRFPLGGPHQLPSAQQQFVESDAMLPPAS